MIIFGLLQLSVVYADDIVESDNYIVDDSDVEETPEEEEMTDLAEVEETASNCQISSEAWGTMIQNALQSFQSMEMDAFQEGRQSVYQKATCLDEVAKSDALVLFHRMEMMHAFTQKDKTTFGAHAQAAYWIDPTFTLEQQELVNQGHPIHQWNAFAIEQVLGRSNPLEIPAQGQLFINGESRTDVPSDLPYLFQQVIDNRVAISQIVLIEEDVPLYPVEQEFTWELSVQPEYAKMTAGLFSASVLSTMIAYRKHQKFWNPATPNSDLKSLQRGVNTWSTIGLLLGTTTIAAIGYEVYTQESE